MMCVNNQYTQLLRKKLFSESESAMKRFLFGITTGAMFMLPLLPVSTAGQDSIGVARNEKTRLEKEIRTIEAKIRQTDSLITREKEHTALLKKRLVDGIEQKKSAISVLREKSAELDAEISALSGSIESKRASGRAIDAQRAYLATQLTDQCGALERCIRKSLPWNREQRLSRVTALKTDIESGAAQIDDGLSRLLALIDEEIAFGDEITLDTRSITRNDGSSVSARVLRLGNLWMAYVDASEELYGILSRTSDTTFSWKETLDFNEREQVRTAIRVKESKKAPQLISLPLTTAITQGESK